MITKEEVTLEWNKVKGEKSLHCYYSSKTDYQRWRSRFIRYGYIKKRTNRKVGVTVVDRAKYSREWRKRNPGRAQEHVARYWAKKFGLMPKKL